MHIHGNQMNLNSVNPYDAAAQKAAAAQRSADVRNKLLNSASEIESASDPEEAFMIRRWVNGQKSRGPGEDEYHTGSNGLG